MRDRPSSITHQPNKNLKHIMKTQLNENVKQLIAKSRIVSFAAWEDTYPQEAIQLFQTADNEGRYLTDEDLHQLSTLLPHTLAMIELAKFLRDRATEIVAEAREQVLAAYPDITRPGGSLYPPERAGSCWRDFWHFLRCITYGIAGSNTEYTSPEGLHNMQLLYRELAVPLDAMVLGLETIKISSLKRIHQLEPENIAPYFDHLIAQLKQFI
jgi:Phycobilisome protein